MAFDFKKEYKEFYMPKNKPAIVTVPKANYIAVRGKGNPNEEGGAYQKAISVLYAVAYTLKMSYKTDYKIDGFFEYVVPPLEVVLCQDLVQVKMRNFSHFNPPEAQPQCVFFYTIVRIHLVTYSYNGYEFVSYCRKFPDIRKSSGMPACNREF